jgi:EmrB/QacA subfamily drug resistance transporter
MDARTAHASPFAVRWERQQMSGYRAIAMTVSSAVFMQFLDATALNTAIPAIARDFHTPAVNLNVAILSYQLALSALIPVGTAAADRFGGRNAFCAALLLFLCGSLLCALSRSLPELVAARAVQGLGGAVMVPVSRLLVVRSAARGELINAMNWLLIPGIVGPLLGPLVGGLIVTYSSWHWIFLINVPVAILGIVMTLVIVPNGRESAPTRFDLRGLLLVAPMISALVFGLESLVRPNAGGLGLVLLGTAAALCLLYLRHARATPFAIIDLTLLRIDSFRHSMISGTLLRVIVGATGFLLPLWFQLAMGMTPAQAGILTMMSAVGALLSRVIAKPLLQQVHPRTVAISCAALLVGALLLTASLHVGLPRPVFWIVLGLQSLLVATALMVISAVAYVDIEPQRAAAAAGFYSTVQQLTLPLGVTAAVWTIAAMRWIDHSTAFESRTYSGSLILLSVLALFAVLAARRLDDRSTGALRSQSAS